MSYFNDILPKTGTISAYLGTNDPPGWIIMNGVARTNNADGRYNALNALGIGTGGSGTSTYTPPDYRGAFLRGCNTAGPSGNLGTITGNYQEDDFATHSHSVNDPGHSHTTVDFYERWDITNSNTASKTGATGVSDGSNLVNSATTGISIQNSGSTETRPYNFSVNWIIKL